MSVDTRASARDFLLDDVEGVDDFEGFKSLICAHCLEFRARLRVLKPRSIQCTMALVQWFLSAGFSRSLAEEYARLVSEQDISVDQLHELDHELLKEIGIKKIGHRLTVLTHANKQGKQHVLGNNSIRTKDRVKNRGKRDNSEENVRRCSFGWCCARNWPW